MKHLMKALALGGALTALAPFAHATSIVANINVAGSDSFTSSTISFPSGQQNTTGGSTLNGTTITYGTAVTFTPGPFTYTPAVNLGSGALLASISSLGLNFYVLTETPTYVANNGMGFTTLDLKGTGYFTETGGFSQTPATFDLTTQEVIGSSAGTITSFSASGITNAPTPEPSSLILLGTGVLGAAGMLRRRFSGK